MKRRTEPKRPDRRERDPKHREAAQRPGAAVIYGVLPILEALRAESRTIEKITIAEGAHEKRLAEIITLARGKGIVVDRVSRQKLNDLAGEGVNHQGVAATVSSASYAELDEILDSVENDAFLLLLDGVEDPRNFGAILRTAECAGAQGVIIPERRAVGLTDTVVKSSAGATEYIKVAKAGNLNRLIEELKEKNIWVVGTAADAEMDHTEWDWTRPTALVLGSEGKGLHRLVAENCDVLVKIPMYGKIRSLNVSVAAGVILFEAQRQRNKLKAE